MSVLLVVGTEKGTFRQHVLCFHNQTNVRWLDELEVPLADGDTIAIHQAVSGGSQGMA